MTRYYRHAAIAAVFVLIFILEGILSGCGIMFSTRRYEPLPGESNTRELPLWMFRDSGVHIPVSPVASSNSASPEPPAPPNTTEPAAPAALIETEPELLDITVMLCGDVLLWGGVQRALDAEEPNKVITPELAGLLREADIALANLEMPVSTRGAPIEDKEYTFRGKPKHLSLLTLSGIDVVSLANNHTLDYGRTALLDTFMYLDEAGIGYAGAGRNLAEASAPWVTEVKGRTVAIICASRVLPASSWNAGRNTPGLLSAYSQKQVNEAITAAKETYDFVIVYVHWGVERNRMPEPYQKEMAYGFIDSGADAVFGTHQHVLQGFEYYNGKPIAYGLGNFVFTTTIPETCAVRMHLTDDDIWLEVIPCTLKSPTTSLVEDAETIQTRLRALEEISFGVTITEDGRVLKDL